MNEPNRIDLVAQIVSAFVGHNALPALICLDTGKKFKSLRRHLGTLGMTPDQYRAKWGLAPDYPMVAPSYAAMRSGIAKQIGLGTKIASLQQAA